MSWAPWNALSHWAPFKIDALGLVTLLGAEEVNSAVGRLVSSAYLEYLPLLGAFVIAGDRFTEKAAGFNLYNISEGIHTTDLAAWLTRWMLSQDFEVTRNYVVWKVTPPRSRKKEIIVSLIVSVILNGFLVAMTILSRDWYGFANALAMIVSIVVRAYVIGQQRLAFDAMVDKAVTKRHSPPKGSYEAERAAYEAWKLGTKAEVRNRKSKTKAREDMSLQTNSSDPAEDPKQATLQAVQSQRPARPDPEKHKSESWTGKDTKVLIIQADSKAVTFWMPNELLSPPSVFIEGPILLHPKLYFAFRALGWLVFAVHIVAIGMADLASQMYTVALLVLPTVAYVLKAGCQDSKWPSTVQALKKSLFHEPSSRGGTSSGGNPPPQADESISDTEFRLVRECWIGSRLKAEIYEWPASYEFRTEGDAKDENWVSGAPPTGEGRSKKRQDLYAWLALDKDEEESMDKWDLFPHIREGNTSWWKRYKRKKRGLKRHPTFGPQLHLGPEEDDGLQLVEGQKPYQVPGRTNTLNFDEDATPRRRQQTHVSVVQAGSSAYPAISDHEQAKVESAEKADDDDAGAAVSHSGSQQVSSGPLGPPQPLNISHDNRVSPRPGGTGTATIDPEADFTHSPTTSTGRTSDM